MTMHDDAFDELASAYLDNEVGAADRAVVDGDALLRARVSEFDGVRNALRFDAGSHSVDDSMINAALTAFDDADDDLGAGSRLSEPPAGRPQPAPVRSLDAARNRRAVATYRWLGAAAAAGVLVVGGVALANRSSTDTQSSASKIEPAASMAAAAESETGTELNDAALEAAPAASDAPAETEAPAEEAPATDGSPALSAIDGPADSSAPVAGAAPTSDTTAASDTPIVTTAEGLAAIGSQAELSIVAEAAINLRVGTTGTTPLISCPELGAEAVSELVWQGRQAFLLLRPNAAAPTEALAVSNNCEILSTVAL